MRREVMKERRDKIKSWREKRPGGRGGFSSRQLALRSLPSEQIAAAACGLRICLTPIIIVLTLLNLVARSSKHVYSTTVCRTHLRCFCPRFFPWVPSPSHLLSCHGVVNQKWTVHLRARASKLDRAIRVRANVGNGKQPVLSAQVQLLHLRRTKEERRGEDTEDVSEGV